MNIEEIFTALAKHMLEGVSYHNEISKAYDFLGLYGFSKCHTYHSMEEFGGYYRLTHYYSTHYHKMLLDTLNTVHNLIPLNWYKYSTLEVDANTKRNAIKELMSKWIEWEKSTKQLYQSMRQELHALGEIDAMNEIENLIHDVSEELKHAEKKYIKLETIGYDLITITDWQLPMYKKYKKLLGW